MLNPKVFEILSKKALKTREKEICKQAAMQYLEGVL